MVVKWSSTSQTFGAPSRASVIGSLSDTSRRRPGRAIRAKASDKAERQPSRHPGAVSQGRKNPIPGRKGKEQTPSSRDLLRLDFGPNVLLGGYHPLLKAVNAWEELIAARLLEFFDWHTLWHRSLWNPGLVMMLKEVLEASEAAQNNILSEDALNLCASSAIRVAALDPGVGDRKVLKALQEALHPKLRYNGLDYAALAELASTLERDYLANWAAYLAPKEITLNPERAARGIAAHLLDLGFSSDYLHRWWTFQTRYDRGQSSLADIVARAEELTKAGNRTFEVLIAFDEITPERFGRPDG
jgi:hypothetical protein